jgi:CheY-like chemotaxis protein
MKTVLVVDDELAIAEMLRAVLEGEGYCVVIASNGEAALASLATTRPDLVLCDVMMPVLDGGDFCRAVKSDPSYQAIPIVLMSAVGETSLRDDLHYDGFVEKPFDLEKILNLVDQLIGGPE